MDKAALVKSDLEAEGRVIEALSRARIPITLVDWNYVPQLDEWQLVVATPWYDSKGPREANRLIINALCLAPDFLDTELSVFMQRLQVQEAAGEPGLA